MVVEAVAVPLVCLVGTVGRLVAAEADRDALLDKRALKVAVVARTVLEVRDKINVAGFFLNYEIKKNILLRRERKKRGRSLS